MCFFYRHPPQGSGVQPVKKWAQIARLVWNEDGKTHPSPNAVKYVVLNWKRVRTRSEAARKAGGRLRPKRTRKS